MRCSRTSLTTGIARQHRDDMTVVTVFSNAVQKTKYHGDKNIVTIDTTVIGSKTAPKKRPETRKIPLHENLRFECVASIGVVMPLPDKIRIATCSATRFCLSREHPLDPLSHAVTQSVNLGKYRHG